MLRFSEPEAEPPWPVSVAPPDHYKFARTRVDAVLPFHSASLLASITGTNSVGSRQLERHNSYDGNFLDITSRDCNSFLFESAPLNQTPGQASLTTNPMDLRVSGLTSHQDSRKPRKHTSIRATMGRESKRHKYAHKNNQPTRANIYPTIEAPVTAVKKSQKLGDKITALQQLVSPFGKTDTASVLQEACVHINVLQEQIRGISRLKISLTYAIC